jgi:phytoene/squalene synthetase
MDRKSLSSGHLAASITRSASKQTFYTIRLFVDHRQVANAYRAYGYFRWLDDVLDEADFSSPDRLAFIQRQSSLLEACYQGRTPGGLCQEEGMLVDLVKNDTEKNSGLQAYLRSMMDVMVFDAGRRGRVISQEELSNYSLKLSTAVTEAMHFFIGHDRPTPPHEGRYLAVTAAHIVHMLRDAVEDAEAGYFNIPSEQLQRYGISPRDTGNLAYQEWVCKRITLARRYFHAGREYLAQVRSLRCRLAGYAYTARFEWMLHLIERDGYCLRSEYRLRKGLRAALWMSWTTLTSLLASPWSRSGTRSLAVQPMRTKEL